MDHEAAKPTILVTGASGFLGSAVVAQLCAQDFSLRTSGRRTLPSGRMPNYTALDLRNGSAISQLVTGVDVVVHAAGLAHQHGAIPEVSDEFFRINTFGTKALIRAAADAGCRRFVLVSSVSVYGSGSPPKTEIDACFPASPYAQSKLEAEQVAIDVADSANTELIILRMATLYGENDPGNVGRLMRAIDGGRFLWIGQGLNHKSLVHVEDAASACVLAATYRQLPMCRTFNVAAEPHTMQEIVAKLAAALGRRAPSLHLPVRVPLAVAAVADKVPGLAIPATRYRAALEKWLSDEVFDATSFRTVFGWQPAVALEDGLFRQALGYHLNQSQARCIAARTVNGSSRATGNCAA